MKEHKPSCPYCGKSLTEMITDSGDLIKTSNDVELLTCTECELSMELCK